jgi:hypothetical protein
MEEPVMKKLIAMLGLLVCVNAYAANQSLTEKERHAESSGCPFVIAVRDLDDFITNRVAELADQDLSATQQIEQSTAAAKVPGVAVGKQMTTGQRAQFETARHFLVQDSLEEQNLRDFQRDVHVIEETLAVAGLTDLYDVQKEDLASDDPRQFYLKVLLLIRAIDPNPSRTNRRQLGVDCDPESGLFSEENISLNLMAGSGQFAASNAKLVDDIERLRSLYQISWQLFNRKADDLRKTVWDGDHPRGPHTEAELVNKATGLNRDLLGVLAYLDKRFPSEKTFAVRYQAAYMQQLNKKYPAK